MGRGARRARPRSVRGPRDQDADGTARVMVARAGRGREGPRGCRHRSCPREVRWAAGRSHGSSEGITGPCRGGQGHGRPLLGSAAMAKVAYQGEPGAYSERAVAAAVPRRRGPAVRHRAPRVLPRHERRGGVRRGAARELAGGLRERELRPAPAHPSLLRIVGEVLVRVDHALLGVPGARLEERAARPLPLAGARAVRGLPGVDADRARPGARHRRRGPPDRRARRVPTDAAIASVDAGARSGLAVLAERIQTEKENLTKFAAIGSDDPGSARARQDLARHGGARRPGSLLASLQPFADRHINLHKLESRPRTGKPFEYVFYVDLVAAAGDPDARGRTRGRGPAHLDAAGARVLPRRRRPGLSARCPAGTGPATSMETDATQRADVSLRSPPLARPHPGRGDRVGRGPGGVRRGARGGRRHAGGGRDALARRSAHSRSGQQEGPGSHDVPREPHALVLRRGAGPVRPRGPVARARPEDVHDLDRRHGLEPVVRHRLDRPAERDPERGRVGRGAGGRVRRRVPLRRRAHGPAGAAGLPDA